MALIDGGLVKILVSGVPVLLLFSFYLILDESHDFTVQIDFTSSSDLSDL